MVAGIAAIIDDQQPGMGHAGYGISLRCEGAISAAVLIVAALI